MQSSLTRKVPSGPIELFEEESSKGLTTENCLLDLQRTLALYENEARMYEN